MSETGNAAKRAANALDIEAARLDSVRVIAEKLHDLGGLDEAIGKYSADLKALQEQITALQVTADELQQSNQKSAAQVSETRAAATQAANDTRRQADEYASGRRKDADAALRQARGEAEAIVAEAKTRAQGLIDEANNAVARITALGKVA